jgi:hypothetical protein
MVRKLEQDDGSLKRLGGGRWQTRDKRFTIEPESGTWVVVDSEQADDLGLPRVRGPFGSLNAAKAAISGARKAQPAVSPLAAKVAEHRGRPSATPTIGRRPHVIEVAKGAARSQAKAAAKSPAKAPVLAAPAKAAAKAAPVPVAAPVEPPPPPPEPKWILDLAPAERRRAHGLIDELSSAGASDPEAIARREIAGNVPSVAAFAVARAIDRLGPKASPAEVARLLADGGAADLGVRWRLVDGEDRSITLEDVPE